MNQFLKPKTRLNYIEPQPMQLQWVIVIGPGLITFNFRKVEFNTNAKQGNIFPKRQGEFLPENLNLSSQITTYMTQGCAK